MECEKGESDTKKSQLTEFISNPNLSTVYYVSWTIAHCYASSVRCESSATQYLLSWEANALLAVYFS